ncbi:MAG: helix-turn-helix transcriptional regulator [Thermoanaerobaculia bacterium]
MAFGRFFGKASVERELPGMRLARFVPTLAKSDVAPHRHEEAHFVFVLRGTYETGAKPAPDGSPPRIVYSPPGTEHRDCFVAGTELARAAFATLSISREALVEVETETRLPGNEVCVGESAVPLVRQLLEEAGGQDALSPFVAEGLCLELLQRTGVARDSAIDSSPAWLRRARELLRDASLGTGSRSVGEVASELGVHPVHLSRRFRTAFGQSPGEYLRRCRLERARRLVRHTTAPLADIAIATGYADQSHFNKAFRRTFGMSPGASRRT